MQYKKYDAYKDSEALWIGTVPSHWDVKKIGQCFQHRKEKVSDRDFEPLSVTMQGIVPQLETAAKSDSGDDRKKVCVGDFVINSRSDRKGSSGVSPLDGSVSLISIILKPLVHDKGYIHHLLRSFEFQEEFYRNGKGIVADLWSTKYSEMKNIKVPLPSTEEQKAIAEFIDKKTSQIDTHIDKQERLIALLKERRTAIINKAVTRGLDENVKLKDSGIDWLGEIPEHWELTKLKHISRINPSSNAKGISRISEVEFIPMENVAEEHGRIKKYNFRPLHEIEKGYTAFKNDDVIFAKITPCMENGNCAIVKNLTYNIGYGSTEFIVFRAIQKKVSIEYLHAILRDKKLRLIAEAHMHGSAGQKRIATSFLANYSIGLPPLKEQFEIVDFITNVIAKAEKSISTIENEIVLLREYRKSLISNAVTGKIRVI